MMVILSPNQLSSLPFSFSFSLFLIFPMWPQKGKRVVVLREGEPDNAGGWKCGTACCACTLSCRPLPLPHDPAPQQGGWGPLVWWTSVKSTRQKNFLDQRWAVCFGQLWVLLSVCSVPSRGDPSTHIILVDEGICWLNKTKINSVWPV